MEKLKKEWCTLCETEGMGLAVLIFILCVVITIAFVFGIFCFEGWIFMLLWNWLAVEVFGASALGYWVCVGLCFAISFVGGLFSPKKINTD